MISQRAAILLTFAAFGAPIGIHVGSIPFIVGPAGVSPSIFGFVSALGMLVGIVAMSLGGLISRFADHRTVLLIALPACYCALWYALLVNGVWSFAFSFVFLSYALGTTDLFMNAEGSEIEQKVGRPIFSFYHASASISIAAFAIIGNLCAALYAPWLGAFFAIPPLVLAWLAVHQAIPNRDIVHGEKERRLAAFRSLVHGEKESRQVALPRRVLTLIGLAGGFNVACEAIAILWAGQLLAMIAPDLAAISGLGLAFFGICGGIMRLNLDYLRASFGELRVMSICIFTAVIGFAVIGLSSSFVVSVIAFAAVGFGLSATWPYLLSLVGRLAPNGTAAAMSYLTAVGGIPRIMLPWFIGVLAQQFSLTAVFSAAALVAILTLCLVVWAYSSLEGLDQPTIGEQAAEK